MNEQEIRIWAWGEVTNYRMLPKGMTTAERLTFQSSQIAPTGSSADELAAWVISGHLPTLETAQ